MKHLILSPPEKAGSLTTKFVFTFSDHHIFPFPFYFLRKIIFRSIAPCSWQNSVKKKRYYLCFSSWFDLQRQLIRNPCDNNTNKLIWSPTFMHQVYHRPACFFFFVLHVGFDRLQINFIFFLRIWLHVHFWYESTCLYWILLPFLVVW